MNFSVQQHSPLRVAYVLKRFPRFSETFILNELLELQRQGISLMVFSLMKPPAEQKHELLNELQCPVIYLPDQKQLARVNINLSVEGSEHKNLITLINRDKHGFEDIMPGKDALTVAHLTYQASVLSLFLNAYQINHIHAHFCSNATTVALLASRITSIPYSFTAHARDIYHTYTNKIDDDRMRANKIMESAFAVTVSDYNKRHLQGLVGKANKKKIKRLYNGVNQQVFRARTHCLSACRLIAIGRLVEKKGFKYLIDACQLLKSRHQQFHLTLVGDGPLREDIMDQIQTYRLEQDITLPGALPQEKIIELLNSATLLVLPCVVSSSGDRDGLPTVLLEAMSMGVPIVSTDVAGIPEIIDHGLTGLLVHPNSSKQLADAMGSLITDSDLANTIGQTGRLKAKRLFNLKTNVTQLAQWFGQETQQKVA